MSLGSVYARDVVLKGALEVVLEAISIASFSYVVYKLFSTLFGIEDNLTAIHADLQTFERRYAHHNPYPAERPEEVETGVTIGPDAEEEEAEADADAETEERVRE